MFYCMPPHTDLCFTAHENISYSWKIICTQFDALDFPMPVPVSFYCAPWSHRRLFFQDTLIQGLFPFLIVLFFLFLSSCTNTRIFWALTPYEVDGLHFSPIL